MVGDADVEIVEARCLYQPTLHYFGISGNAIADKGVLKDVEIGVDGSGMNAALLGNVIVVDDLSIGECCYLKEPMESVEIAQLIRLMQICS